jgi:hypothetical protein
MKKLLVFAALVFMANFAYCACDGSYQTLIYTEQGGAQQRICSGGAVTYESGSTLQLASGASLSLAGAISAPGLTITGTGATALTVGGGITAGTGVVGIVGTDGRIPAISSTYFTSLSGASLTTLTPANIQAGYLPGGVIASSIAINAVEDVSIVGMTSSKLSGALPAVSGASLTSLTAANISGGTLGITVVPYSSADCEALTPVGEGEFCYDTTLHVMNASTSTAPGGFAPMTN